MNALSEYWRSTLDLLLPRICASCSEPLLAGEEHLCLGCRLDLPYTRSEDDPKSVAEKLFWGKVNLVSAGAMLHFTKGGHVQQLLHRIKYQSDRSLAGHLGRLMAERLNQSDRFNDIDMILPVPLHRKKERARGYNQSQLIGDALGVALDIPCRSDLLIRTVRTCTQTNKSRVERWDNVKYVFKVTDPGILQDKHVLLIDDVVTTGATIEGCAKSIRRSCNARISAYTTAIA